MNIQNLQKSGLWRSGMMLAAMGFTSALAAAGQQDARHTGAHKHE